MLEITDKIKLIEGFNGDYAIASTGEVWSSKYHHVKNRHSQWRRLKPTNAGDGYKMVKLRRNSEAVPFYIHHLVAHYFIGPRPAGHHVAHWDGDKANNNVTNLRYATPKENNADKVRHGTVNRGERQGSTHLTDDDVREIRRLSAMGLSCKKIGSRFNICAQSVHNIRTGATWSHVRNLQSA